MIRGNVVPEEFIILSKAFEELDVNLNAKFALLEIFIVAELAISKALQKLKLDAGVSKGKLKEYRKEVSISYCINIELPAFCKDLSDQERQVLGDIDKTRKLRNDVVHEGAPVSQEQALESIKAVSNLLVFLLNRKLI